MREHDLPPLKNVDTRRTLGTEDAPISVGMVHKEIKIGNGSRAPIDTPEGRQLVEEGRQRAILRKNALREAYELKLAAALEGMANLQATIISLANDPNSKVSRDEMDKLRLGLQATEMIANRVLGKVKNEVEAKITSSVVDEMMEVATEWVLEEEDIVEE